MITQKWQARLIQLKITKIVNDDIEAIQNWSVTNGTKFNVNKYSMMLCGRLNKNINSKLYGQKIRFTKKDLGVIINNDMKFNNQGASVAKKANNH